MVFLIQDQISGIQPEQHRDIANVATKLLQSDWSRGVQRKPYCTLGLNIVLFDEKTKKNNLNSTTFDLCGGRR